MDITKFNFMEHLDDICSAIKKANVISLDLELSGLGRHNKNWSRMDTPRMRYEYARKISMQYGILQVGISMFHLSPDKKLKSSTYCFCIRGPNDGSFKSDASALNFLARNNMDFNKIFKGGLPYISQSEMLEKKENFFKKESVSKVQLNPFSIKFRRDMIEKVTQAKRKMENCKLEDLSPAIMKMAMQELPPMFPSVIFIKEEEAISVFPCETVTEKNRLENAYKEKVFKEMYGFGVVVEEIISAGKPLIGHNMFIDVLHFVDKFISPLPCSIESFNDMTKKSFHSFYDTKSIAHDPAFLKEDLSLEALYEELAPLILDVDRDNSELAPKIHDAGYDSYITGLCFIAMLRRKGCELDGTLEWNSTFLKDYKNQAKVPYIFDMDSVDLKNLDVTPDRSFVYSVTCSPTWKAKDIQKLFNPEVKKYKTVWVDDTHVCVVPTEPTVIGNKSIEQTVKNRASRMGAQVAMRD